MRGTCRFKSTWPQDIQDAPESRQAFEQPSLNRRSRYVSSERWEQMNPEHAGPGRRPAPSQSVSKGNNDDGLAQAQCFTTQPGVWARRAPWFLEDFAIIAASARSLFACLRQEKIPLSLFSCSTSRRARFFRQMARREYAIPSYLSCNEFRQLCDNPPVKLNERLCRPHIFAGFPTVDKAEHLERSWEFSGPLRAGKKGFTNRRRSR
jgi:hypothetical protein